MRKIAVFGALAALLVASVPGHAASAASERTSGDPAVVAAVERDVRAFLARWLEVQNKGDLQGYGALYARSFFGVRRTGESFRSFDRDGWLQDRGRMFRKPMTVELAELTIAPSVTMVTVRFTQTWASDGFKDTGPKEMVLVRDGDSFAISREELLRSVVLQESAPLADGAFQWVVVVDGRPRLVLSRDLSGYEYAGQPKVVAEDGLWVLTRAVRAPTETKAWKGRTVVVHDGVTRIGEAKVGAISAVVRFVPHFGTEGHWREELPKREVPGEAWDLGVGGGGLLVADLELAEPVKVEGVEILWARDAKLPAPTLYSDAVPAEVTEAAERRFRGLEEFRAEAASYKALDDDQKDGPFELFDGATGFRDPATGRTFVGAWGHTGGGCGGFWASLSAVWEATEKGGKVRLRGALDPSGDPAQLLGVFDLNGDGKPEFLRGTDTYTPNFTLEGKGIFEELTIPYYDCPC